MEDRQIKFRVGLIAFATLVVAALLVAYTTRVELSLSTSLYPLQIQVNRAPGIGPNTPVRRDGVLIGRVERTESIRGGVLIVAQIQSGQQVLASDVVRIRPSSLLGDAVVDIVQAGDFDAPPQPVDAGATIRGSALPDPIEALTALQVDVGPAVQSLGQAADAVTSVAKKIDAVLGEDLSGEKALALVDTAGAALESFDATMVEVRQVANSLEDVIGDPAVREKLREGLANIPEVIDVVAEFLGHAVETVDNLDAAIVAARTNLDNLRGLTKPLGDRGPELAQLVIDALTNLDAAVTDARSFTQALSDSEGTLGKLVNDPALYEDARVVVSNVNVVLMKINKLANQLEPILQDARVFADKIAREPGRLVGGAINRGPGIK
ncbi:MAG: MlaD family protein [Planctomycetota bacterium]